MSLSRQTLIATPRLRVEVSVYAPGARQGRHRDNASRITLTLGGGFHEEADKAGETFTTSDILFKSHRACHADAFGPDGAKLASIVFEADTPVDDWRPRRDARALRLMLTALGAARAGDEHGVTSAANDLIASDEAPASAAAPNWLQHLHDELATAPLARIDVAARAEQAGVHPAHASRLFRRCFGRSITDHAQIASVRRALKMITNARLSETALAAGFYDQSHMNRAFRRVTGHTPAACRVLLAAG
jgi:AraC family transcriptional regulator